MDDTEGVTTPPTLQSVLDAMAETLRAAGYAVTKNPATDLPAQLLDADGDTWHLSDNGGYTLILNGLPSLRYRAWDRERIEADFGPLTTIETAPPTKNPAKLCDEDGDIWYLCPNGNYSLAPDRADAQWTLDVLRKYYDLTEVTE